MSLTSTLKNKEIRELFSDYFKKPRCKILGEIKAAPLTKNYQLVGTAFDYLLRFYLSRLNPNAISKGWVSENSLMLLELAQNPDRLEKLPEDDISKTLKEKIESNPSFSDPALYEKVENVIMNGKQKYEEYLNSGIIDDGLLMSIMKLAKVDLIYRAGLFDETLGIVDKNDVKDLRNLISLVEDELFLAKETCYLNPTFNEGSLLVGGADADIVIDNKLIDIKTTKNLNVTRDAFNQIIGYYILGRIGGIGNPKLDGSKIDQIGIYFSRHGILYLYDVEDIIDLGNLQDFISTFKNMVENLSSSDD